GAGGDLPRKTLVVLDPTEYAKRSRGCGKTGRQREHNGRVRRTTAKTTPSPKNKKRQPGPPPAPRGAPAPTTRAQTAAPARAATSYGYGDVWAGLALAGKQFLPLARQLFSSAHPPVTSQNRVEEAVLAQALTLVQEAGLGAIVLGDRDIGRKELIV